MTSLFAERYELLELIGEGEHTLVYRARDLRLGRTVAIKLLRRDSVAPAGVAGLQAEARLAATLAHPNVVDVYDYGETDGLPYIVMEYVPGGNVRQRIDERGPLSPMQAIAVARQILAALAVGHRQGIVHRDIKPQNILLTPGGAAKLADFGIATAGDDTSERGDATTTVGTALYMSPEQAMGNPVGPPSDLYSLGAVLYEMLTGRPPFDGASAHQIATQHVRSAVPPIGQLRPGLPMRLQQIIQRALSKDPASRYPDAAAMDRDLALVALGAGEMTTEMAPIGDVLVSDVPPAPSVTARQARVAYQPAPVPVPPISADTPPPRRTPVAWPLVVLLVAVLALCAIASALAARSLGFFDGAAPARTPLSLATATRLPPSPTVPVAAPPPASSTASPVIPSPTVAVIVPPSPTSTGTPPSTPTPQPTMTNSPVASPTSVPPTATAVPSATPPPLPTATPPPVPTATPLPVPTATPQPPSPTRTFTPAPTSTSTAVPSPTPTVGRTATATSTPSPVVVLDDTAFTGGFREPGQSEYRGRSVFWLYGAETQYFTATANFNGSPLAGRETKLAIVGLESPAETPIQLEVLVNDQLVARAATTFEQDSPDPRWNKEFAVIVPGRFIQTGQNSLTLRHVTSGAQVGQPPWIAVDEVKLSPVV